MKHLNFRSPLPNYISLVRVQWATLDVVQTHDYFKARIVRVISVPL